MSLMLNEDFRSATEPLFAAGEIEALSWSFDAWPDPGWARGLVDSFEQRHALYGHGVSFGLFGADPNRHAWWLESLRGLCAIHEFRNLTVHFGFIGGGGFLHGAPLPVPLSEAALKRGRNNLEAIAARCSAPVGVENLAFALFAQDALSYGEFIDDLLEPVDGVLVLDIHNIYCQLENFSLSSKQLLESYPLHRVQEIHVSGGSWSESEINPGKRVRRDTHDGPVPERVFELLEEAIPKCPNLEVVIFERFGGSIRDAQDAERMRQDYRRMKRIVSEVAQ